MKKFISTIKKKNIKLAITVVGTATISLTLASNAMAISPVPGVGDPLSGAGVVLAIRQLSNEVKALAKASVKTTNAMLYQIDSYLLPAVQANSEADTANNQAQEKAAYLTQNQISNSLLQFPEKAVNSNQLNDPVLAQLINEHKKVISNLSTKTPASDTLYINSSTNPFASKYGVAKPTNKYDNYFNFDSLIIPTAYYGKQQTAANEYINYVSKQYQSFTNGINFAKLKSQLNNLNPNQRAQKLQSIVNNPTYQKYQLTVRSLLASKSVALSNLNYLLSERTPVKGLAEKAGIPNNPKLPRGYASPLEVENYIANQRLNNPKWAEAMKTASPATVNREQLIILAEIERGLHRNHLDNERLLATLSVMMLQSNQIVQMNLKIDAQKVNELIDPSKNQTTK